jgi:G:T-mismatch repair DNA endonuclease (very short patch repair protein)
LIVWECSLRKPNFDATIRRVAQWIVGTGRYLEVGNEKFGSED